MGRGKKQVVVEEVEEEDGDEDDTSGSGSGYAVTTSKCLTLHFIMQYTIHLSLTTLLF
jgi:hypothetical protein